MPTWGFLMHFRQVKRQWMILGLSVLTKIHLLLPIGVSKPAIFFFNMAR